MARRTAAQDVIEVLSILAQTGAQIHATDVGFRLGILDKNLDSEEKEKAHMLNILADNLRTASSDLRQEKKSHSETKVIHESYFGKQKGNDVNYTSQVAPVSDDIMGMYDYKIEDREREVDFLQEQTLRNLKDISYINRLQVALPTVSKVLGADPNRLDPEDVTPVVLAPQFTKGPPEEIATAERLIGSYFEQRPEVVSPGALEAINLLAAKTEAQAAEHDWAADQRIYIQNKREEDKTKAIVASNLAFSPFVKAVDVITKGDDSDSEQVEKIMALGAQYGQNIGDLLFPGENKKAQYDATVRAYRAMASFGKGSTAPKDITGLGRLVDNLKAQYKASPGKVGDLSTEKGIFADWVSKMFNINMENIDHLYFEGYDPIKKEKKDFKMSEFSGMSPAEVLRIEFANSGETQAVFLKRTGKDFYKAFRRVYPNKNPNELKQMILESFKKKSEKDIAVIRKKLVDSGFPLVDVTADTGFFSVLAGGEARIRLAKPMAEKFLKAKEILANKGIDLQIGDSFVHFDVKKKQYEDWVAGGKKGSIVAPPDRSFHTVGYAFDLEQTNEMKRPEVAEVMESLGLERSETEWWHWSLEKL